MTEEINLHLPDRVKEYLKSSNLEKSKKLSPNLTSSNIKDSRLLEKARKFLDSSINDSKTAENIFKLYNLVLYLIKKQIPPDLIVNAGELVFKQKQLKIRFEKVTKNVAQLLDNDHFDNILGCANFLFDQRAQLLYVNNLAIYF